MVSHTSGSEVEPTTHSRRNRHRAARRAGAGAGARSRPAPRRSRRRARTARDFRVGSRPDPDVPRRGCDERSLVVERVLAAARASRAIRRIRILRVVVAATTTTAVLLKRGRRVVEVREVEVAGLGLAVVVRERVEALLVDLRWLGTTTTTVCRSDGASVSVSRCSFGASKQRLWVVLQSTRRDDGG